MATEIESIATFVAPPGAPEGSRDLAFRAAQKALANANGGKGAPISLLVYAGVHRDDHVVEPAQAPYVQRSLGDNAGATAANPSGTFSFDVDRLSAALQIADGLFRSRGLSRALIVAADSSVRFTHPAGHELPAAAAALSLRVGQEQGFEAFCSADWPQHAELHQASVQWSQEAGESRHRMRVHENPRYLEACLDCAEAIWCALLAELDYHPTDKTLVVSSQAPVGLPAALPSRLGLHSRQVVDATRGGNPVGLTAGPLIALEKAIGDGRYAAADRVVFLTVDPGIAACAAMYRKPARA